MKKTLFEIWLAICQKAGINTTGEAFAKFKEAIGNIEVDEAIATAIGTLMTEEAAKNSPSIKAHFTAQALNGVDTAFEIALTEAGFTAEEIKGMKDTEANTFKRPAQVISKLKEKLGKDTGTGDEKSRKKLDDLTNMVNTLQAEKATIVETHKAELASHISQMEGQQVDFALKGMFGGLAKNPHISPELFDDYASVALSKKLATLGAKIVMKSGQLAVVKADDPTLDFHHDNVKLTPQAIIDLVATESKLVAVSDGNHVTRTGTLGGDGDKGTTPNPAAKPGVNAIRQALDESRESFQFGAEE